MLQHAFIVRNWKEIGAIFPKNIDYTHLLLYIGGETNIRLIDNITNSECHIDMKLSQYLYTLSKDIPENREFSMNLISLECSGSILDTQIIRPLFIREIDWISPNRHCWFRHNKFSKYFYSTTNNIRGIVDDENHGMFNFKDGIKTMDIDDDIDNKQSKLDALKRKYLLNNINSSGFPEIQKYILISSANSFTQWHTDFNGSTVWYYMVEGFKYFYIIYPTKNIR